MCGGRAGRSVGSRDPARPARRAPLCRQQSAGPWLTSKPRSPRRGPGGGWPLYGAGFLTAFGAHGVAANLGVSAAGQGASLVTVGLLLALYDAAEVILKPVFGSLADRIGPRPVILGGVIGFAAASAAFVLIDDPALLGAARFAQGAAAAAFSPAASAMVGRLGGPRTRGRSFGGYGAAKSSATRSARWPAAC